MVKQGPLDRRAAGVGEGGVPPPTENAKRRVKGKFMYRMLRLSVFSSQPNFRTQAVNVSSTRKESSLGDVTSQEGVQALTGGAPQEMAHQMRTEWSPNRQTPPKCTELPQTYG